MRDHPRCSTTKRPEQAERESQEFNVDAVDTANESLQCASGLAGWPTERQAVLTVVSHARALYVCLRLSTVVPGCL